MPYGKSAPLWKAAGWALAVALAHGASMEASSLHARFDEWGKCWPWEVGLAWAVSYPPSTAWLTPPELLGFALVVLLAQIQVLLLGWRINSPYFVASGSWSQTHAGCSIGCAPAQVRIELLVK